MNLSTSDLHALAALAEAANVDLTPYLGTPAYGDHFLAKQSANDRFRDAAALAAVELIERVLRAEALANVAAEYYDGLDVDQLDPQYFAAGAPGEGQRRLRDAVREWRRAVEEQR